MMMLGTMVRAAFVVMRRFVAVRVFAMASHGVGIART